MSNSFKRIPVSAMPRSEFYRQIVIVVAIGLVLILAAGLYSIWFNTVTGLRDAQQRGVHVQMAVSRIGEQYYGLDKSLYKTGAVTGQLNDEAQTAVLSAASESGTVKVYDFDYVQMQATNLIYEDGDYTVEYDAKRPQPWTVTSHRLPITRNY